MRKVAVLVTALAAVLAVAAVAFAAQVNTYTVVASNSPITAGSAKKPVPVSVSFNYSVGETTGQRPAVVSAYSILFKGLRTNGKYFAKCSAATINATGSAAKCPKGSKIGAGNVENLAGPQTDPNDKSIPCHLDLNLYNAGQGKLTLFLAGSPTAPKPCAVKIAAAIPGSFTKVSGGTALRFAVPASLRHPITGVDNAVVQTNSVITRRVVRVKGKRHGFFESVGGCAGGKRAVVVTFTPENGTPAQGRTTSRCKK